MSDLAIVEASFDAHGYHADELTGFVLETVVRQAWEGGADRLTIIHGHGRHRPTGIRGAVPFNCGFLGLRIRNELSQPSQAIRLYIKSTVLDCSDPGRTRIRLKKNPSPTRTDFDLSDVLPQTKHRRDFETERAWEQHRSAAS
jgi:hypothetical protein